MSFYGLIAIFADMNPRYLLSLLTVLMALVAMASGNFDWTLRLEYLRIRATDPKAPVSERMACYDSLIRSAGDKVPAEYTIGKARLYESIGDFVSSQREFELSIPVCRLIRCLTAVSLSITWPRRNIIMDIRVMPYATP